ncbi:zinc finger BED domain-containing protein RICESLEEPER 2 [Tanacetum coccineum]|uniref:Zinc finger BED domain-containing protein RICESLEEPER 2 n=1 Tax=Tanacetum coccineum TaxID=301880 RepID=A0ABQ5FLX4_9ASTR
MATQSSSTTTGVGSSSALSILQVLTTTRNPEIWQHYNLCKMSDNTTKAQFAFESAFSTSGRVLSIRRTRLTPASLEMCMCLKGHSDAAERIQHTSKLKNALDFEEEILEEEVQENEAIAFSDEEIALDEAASEARSNGSGSRGDEFDLTMFD